MSRRTAPPIATSVAIHGAAVMLVLALTRSDGMVERPTPQRAMILLAPPLIHPVPYQAQRRDRIPPRLFRAPVIRTVTAPLQEPILVPEVARPPLMAVEIAGVANAVPPPLAPPLRTDNFAPLAARSVSGYTPAALRPSGFEQIAVETQPRPRAPPLAGGEFDDATLISARQPHRASVAPAPPVSRSVEILSKPRPAYTEEARRERIEGEVLLDILFAASGQVRVLGTLHGLGHGLDESAIVAAQAIRFRPAERAGIATDSTAIVHIVFQLAF